MSVQSKFYASLQAFFRYLCSGECLQSTVNRSTDTGHLLNALRISQDASSKLLYAHETASSRVDKSMPQLSL